MANTQEIKKKLIRLGRLQNIIQLLKKANKDCGLSVVNEERLNDLEKDADELYKEIEAEK